MKTLQIFEPGIDGVFRHVESLTEFVSGRGVACDFFYSTVRSSLGLIDFIAKKKSEGADCTDMKVGNGPQILDFFILFKLILKIATGRYDNFHAHSSKAGGLVRLACLLMGERRVIYTPHALYGMSKTGSRTEVLFNLVERFLSISGKIITISEDENTFARDHLSIIPSRLLQIHNPVSQRLLDAATVVSMVESREQLNLPKEKILLGIVGRLGRQKQPELLFQTIEELGQSENIAIVHLAPGNQIEELKRLHFTKYPNVDIRFLEYMEKVELFYSSVDALVVASKYEAGLPLVMLEAFAFGLPVIASNCPGISSSKKHISSADVFYYEIDSIETLKEHIVDITNNFQIRPFFSQNNYKLVKSEFSEEKKYGLTEKIYQAESDALVLSV